MIFKVKDMEIKKIKKIIIIHTMDNKIIYLKNENGFTSKELTNIHDNVLYVDDILEDETFPNIFVLNYNTKES